MSYYDDELIEERSFRVNDDESFDEPLEDPLEEMEPDSNLDFEEEDPDSSYH